MHSKQPDPPRRRRSHLLPRAAFCAVLLGSSSALAEDWTLELVDVLNNNLGTTAQWTSLAMEARGRPRISYHESTFTRLKYASRAAGTWTVEIVDDSASVGEYNSLALDANGTPHISYYDNSFNRLKYAVYDTLSSTWDVQIVDESTSVGKFTSLALDASGHPFISYHDDLNGDLKVASNTGGGWVIETVGTAGNTGFYTSIALDASGNPRVSYSGAGTSS
ncbi:MAG: hypothetical protein HRU01_02165 [Myxococcales bacterium]|nr:hypothetical protein [Myxococcales bacterium]